MSSTINEKKEEVKGDITVQRLPHNLVWGDTIRCGGVMLLCFSKTKMAHCQLHRLIADVFCWMIPALLEHSGRAVGMGDEDEQ